jgi:hypothetical protein
MNKNPKQDFFPSQWVEVDLFLQTIIFPHLPIAKILAKMKKDTVVNVLRMS